MMAMVIDQPQQQQPYKYYCRICKKGFGCGRALGGHMRAHGINDDPAGTVDDSSGCSEWAPPGNKRMYALRANPNRPKSCRLCENCGKEFLSWKSFLEHGKCSSNDDDDDDDEDDDSYYYDSLGSSPRSDGADDEGGAGYYAGRSKGKRSRRLTKYIAASTSEEEDLANCLVMLSSARVDPTVTVEPEESCASASKDEDRRYYRPMIDKCKGPAPPPVPKGMFECKACKKVFTSHQALGGHRASHKKVKGCFAAKADDPPPPPPPPEVDDVINHYGTDQEDAAAAAAALAMAIVPFDNVPIAVTPIKKKSKVHECSICHRQFASGQALGGHKRCHWITSNSRDPSTVGKIQPIQMNPANHELTLRPMFDPTSERIDLNLPAPAGSPLRLATSIYQRPWMDQDHDHKKGTTATTISSNDNNNNVNNYYEEGGCSMQIVEEEVSSKVKLAKLSELKDGGEASSPWLQVGIGSSGNEGSEP